MLATHQWLAHLVRKGGDLDLVPTAAAESAYDDHRHLLLEYFSSLKIKTTPLPLPLQCLVSILKIAYTVFIFPQTMAYAFVMKLSSGHHEKFFIWRNPVYICAYLLITTLGVLFFTVMHLIALELDDPYGDDLSDLPMKQIHNALKADLEAIHHTSTHVFLAHTRAGDLELEDEDDEKTTFEERVGASFRRSSARISASLSKAALHVPRSPLAPAPPCTDVRVARPCEKLPPMAAASAASAASCSSCCCSRICLSSFSTSFFLLGRTGLSHVGMLGFSASRRCFASRRSLRWFTSTCHCTRESASRCHAGAFSTPSGARRCSS